MIQDTHRFLSKVQMN